MGAIISLLFSWARKASFIWPQRSYQIICVVHEEHYPFTVTVGRQASIEAVVREIVAYRNGLGGVDPVQIQFFHCDIDHNFSCNVKVDKFIASNAVAIGLMMPVEQFLKNAYVDHNKVRIIARVPVSAKLSSDHAQANQPIPRDDSGPNRISLAHTPSQNSADSAETIALSIESARPRMRELGLIFLTEHFVGVTEVLLMLLVGYSSPHRTINEYLRASTDFTPTDEDIWSNEEPSLPGDFDFSEYVARIDYEIMSEPLRRKLRCVIRNHFFTGRHIPIDIRFGREDEWVRSGIARLAPGCQPVIDEPMPILAALMWMQKSPELSLFGDIRHATGRPQQAPNCLEAYVAYYLRNIFTEPRNLHEVFTFQSDFATKDDCSWKRERYQLVAVDSSEDRQAKSRLFTVTSSSGPSPNIGLLTESMDQVLSWLTDNRDRYTFCFPHTLFGPDLMFFLQSVDSKRLVLVMVQVQTQPSISEDALTQAIRSVTRSWLWKRKGIEFNAPEVAPANKGCEELIPRTEDALNMILLGGDHNCAVMRVLVSHPTLENLQQSPAPHSPVFRLGQESRKNQDADPTDSDTLATLNWSDTAFLADESRLLQERLRVKPESLPF
ncbi:hypothetical protein FRC17_007476 [Serendipita sp. 399]|nr:hypothetical protein FRC17_007476 [Serendipita sp. 399]